MTRKEPTRTGPEDPHKADHKRAHGDDAPPAQAAASPTGQAHTPPEAEAAADALEAQAANNEVEQLRLDLEEVTDRALRAQAELENFRRRVARQIEDERRYANMPLLRDLLPVLDDMRRAAQAAETTQDAASLLDGFKMVAKHLEEVLARYHCTEIQALGAPFDPHLHEAISQQPSVDQPPGTVLLVTQSGFQLHDRVVRPSQVIVSGAPPQQQAEEAPENNNGGEDGQ